MARQHTVVEELHVTVHSLGGRELCRVVIDFWPNFTEVSHANCAVRAHLAGHFPFGFKLVAGSDASDRAFLRTVAVRDGKGRLHASITAVSLTPAIYDKLVDYVRNGLGHTNLTVLEWHVQSSVRLHYGEPRPTINPRRLLPECGPQRVHRDIRLVLAVGILLRQHFSARLLVVDLLRRIFFMDHPAAHDHRTVELVASTLCGNEDAAAPSLWDRAASYHDILVYHGETDEQLLWLLATAALGGQVTKVASVHQGLAAASLPVHPDAGLVLLLKHMLPWHKYRDLNFESNAGPLFIQASHSTHQDRAHVRDLVRTVCLEVIEQELPDKAAAGLVPLPAGWRLSAAREALPRARLQRKTAPPLKKKALVHKPATMMKGRKALTKC